MRAKDAIGAKVVNLTQRGAHLPKKGIEDIDIFGRIGNCPTDYEYPTVDWRGYETLSIPTLFQGLRPRGFEICHRAQALGDTQGIAASQGQPTGWEQTRDGMTPGFNDWTGWICCQMQQAGPPEMAAVDDHHQATDTRQQRQGCQEASDNDEWLIHSR